MIGDEAVNYVINTTYDEMNLCGAVHVAYERRVAVGNQLITSARHRFLIGEGLPSWPQTARSVTRGGGRSRGSSGQTYLYFVLP